jgi:hypothetical protein
MPVPSPAHPTPIVWRATGTERPVFLDESGRRRRRVQLIAAAAALVAGVWLCGLVGGGVGFSRLPPAPLSAHARPAHEGHRARVSGAASALTASAALAAVSGRSHGVPVVLLRPRSTRARAVERFAVVRRRHPFRILASGPDRPLQLPRRS